MTCLCNVTTLFSNNRPLVPSWKLLVTTCPWPFITLAQWLPVSATLKLELITARYALKSGFMALVVAFQYMKIDKGFNFVVNLFQISRFVRQVLLHRSGRDIRHRQDRDPEDPVHRPRHPRD